MIHYIGNCGANLPKFTRVGLILGSFLPSEIPANSQPLKGPVINTGEGSYEMGGGRARQHLPLQKVLCRGGGKASAMLIGG